VRSLFSNELCNFSANSRVENPRDANELGFCAGGVVWVDPYDVVGLGIFSTGELLRREGRNLLAVFLVEPALQPGGTSLGGASNVRFAGKLQVPANLSVGSPTIAAEPAKSGIPARAGTIAIARKDREASLIVVVAAENSPLPAARGPAGRGATPQAGCPPAPPNVERNKRC
jgi:hypothetical protein